MQKMPALLLTVFTVCCAFLYSTLGCDKLEAQVIVMNASSAPGIPLKTADGSTAIVEPLDPRQLEGRAVNTVKIPLSVYTDNDKVGDNKAHLLERRARYAVVIYDGPKDKPAVSFN